MLLFSLAGFLSLYAELEPERPQHILTEQGVGYRLRAQEVDPTIPIGE